MKSACALLASSLLFAACTSAPAPEPAAPAATGRRATAEPTGRISRAAATVPRTAAGDRVTIACPTRAGCRFASTRGVWGS